jgi:hypothetical protein
VCLSVSSCVLVWRWPCSEHVPHGAWVSPPPSQVAPYSEVSQRASERADCHVRRQGVVGALAPCWDHAPRLHHPWLMSPPHKTDRCPLCAEERTVAAAVLACVLAPLWRAVQCAAS